MCLFLLCFCYVQMNPTISAFIDKNFPPMFKQLMNKEAVVNYVEERLQDGNAVEQLFIDIVPQETLESLTESITEIQKRLSPYQEQSQVVQAIENLKTTAKILKKCHKTQDIFSNETRKVLLKLTYELEEEHKKTEDVENNGGQFTSHEIMLGNDVTAANFRFFTGEALYDLAGFIGVDRHDGRIRTINRIVAYAKGLKEPKSVGFECPFSRTIRVSEMTIDDMLFTLSEEQLKAAADVVLSPGQIHLISDTIEFATLIKNVNKNICI